MRINSDRRLAKEKEKSREGQTEMSTDNTGVQTRAMAQRSDSEPQETQNQNMNPTVELYKTKDDSIKDFIRKNGTIALDWYVPDFSNTRVGDLVEQRLPIEQEQARARDEQLRSVRQTDRSGLNFFAPANSPPIRNDNSRPDNQGVHFKTNPTRHIYSTTSDDNHSYEPPENDSIIQTASPPQMDQPTTGTTKSTNRNTLWRHNSNTGTTVGTVTHRTTSVTTTDADPHASDAENEDT